ncbi:MAG: DUF5117 domain-containing protein [Halieaceae bacterium]|jgi:hypothetical protein|nr:DUF5117 domain-containing protein [Halieaceae bacterium]
MRVLGLICLLILIPNIYGAEEEQAPSYGQQIEGLKTQRGLLDVHQDTEKGRILISLPPADQTGFISRLIYTEYLASGLGSNPVGLDRSQFSKAHVLVFRKVGSKVYASLENSAYIAVTENLLEKAATRDSFGFSTIWAGEIKAISEDEKLLVDISSLLLRDTHGIAATLEKSEQGTFEQADHLSYVDPQAALVFPRNIELEAVLTFESSQPGIEVVGTTPDPRSLSLRVHHSLAALPEAGYSIRWADPRTGVLARTIRDYAAPLDKSVVRQMAIRHRLIKKNSGAGLSEPVEPIVYYVDSGAPEAVKSALIDGGKWWEEAFQAAGFKDAYRVEEMPEGVHPLDIRYNVVNWVHRQTRGWSYGQTIVDPRTGEILKGHVLLGSLRVRQDRMIFEGLVGSDKMGSGKVNDPIRASLARIRQLSAHEIGHTLGFGHNMAASTVLDKSSVMDYPAPDPSIDEDGQVTLENVYSDGVGAWDLFTTRWLYSEIPADADETTFLDDIVTAGFNEGLRFVSDAHSRPVSAAHPFGSVWDNGEDPVAKLKEVMQIRRLALDRLGMNSISEGRPLTELKNVLVPIYLFHRYQLASAVKSVGGVDYSYKRRGDNLPIMAIVSPEQQMRALNAVLSSLDPVHLDLNEALLELLNPGVFVDAITLRERFPERSRPMFNLLVAAEVASSMTLQAILNPVRIARLVEHHIRDAAFPSLDQVMNTIEAKIFQRQRNESARHEALRRVTQANYVRELQRLLSNSSLAAESENAIRSQLSDLKTALNSKRASKPWKDHDENLRSSITRFLERPAKPVQGLHDSMPSPPGSPIGFDPWSETAMSCWFCDVTVN